MGPQRALGVAKMSTAFIYGLNFIRDRLVVRVFSPCTPLIFVYQ